MNARELGTVLAALRYWQATLTGDSVRLGEIHAIATNIGEFTALRADEIDELCEQLNTEEPVKIVMEVIDDTSFTFTTNREGVEVIVVDHTGDEDVWTHTLTEPDEGFERVWVVPEVAPKLVSLMENAKVIV
jgi:hypothetical protein